MPRRDRRGGRGAAVRDARPPELLGRRGGDGRRGARAEPLDDAGAPSEQRGLTAALLRDRLGLDKGVRPRRGGHPFAVGAAGHGDDPGGVVGGTEADRRIGRPRRRRARRLQPGAGLVLAGGAGLRTARPAVRRVARLHGRGPAHARTADARMVGARVGARDRHSLLRRVRRDTRGGRARVATARAPPCRDRVDGRRRRGRRGPPPARDPPGWLWPRRLDQVPVAPPPPAHAVEGVHDRPCGDAA